MDSDLKKQLIEVLRKGEILCEFARTHGFKSIDIMSSFDKGRDQSYDLLELGIEFEQLAEELQDV